MFLVKGRKASNSIAQNYLVAEDKKLSIFFTLSCGRTVLRTDSLLPDTRENQAL